MGTSFTNPVSYYDYPLYSLFTPATQQLCSHKYLWW